MKEFFRPFLVLLLVSGMSIFHSTNALADVETDVEKTDIDITLSPTETLFDISNMKPGDWADRTITVSNSGNKDFDYLIEVQNTGDLKLFNELLLEIQVGNVDLYTGKLADFKVLPKRNLVSGGNEDLDITIRFPEHLGNDFQGVQSAFTIIFTAERKDSTAVQAITQGLIDSGGGAKSIGLSLPATSTNIFNMMLFGSVLMVVGIVLLFVRYRRRMKLAQ
ncbi:LPXTG cell wall anchor domain-containing protein [Sporosarcina sp. Sa2YVA2]|uniref:LPXTG cell wall anchor domain-containing protein n=1 Tax=Sporosarcina quadrami TaxID=2762234 RepID=A0ABR8U936_9BACL|nr:LPXTG cell wall anchor domain-containing protein [Sporosarcina quadrami]MBD7984549.1 LPXTG cell wall anchor domain-containing protein [Sporosarcina quadrami]